MTGALLLTSALLTLLLVAIVFFALEIKKYVDKSVKEINEKISNINGTINDRFMKAINKLNEILGEKEEK